MSFRNYTWRLQKDNRQTNTDCQYAWRLGAKKIKNKFKPFGANAGPLILVLQYFACQTKIRGSWIFGIWIMKMSQNIWPTLLMMIQHRTPVEQVWEGFFRYYWRSLWWQQPRIISSSSMVPPPSSRNGSVTRPFLMPVSEISCWTCWCLWWLNMTNINLIHECAKFVELFSFFLQTVNCNI